jgi:hypothetical protein
MPAAPVPPSAGPSPAIRPLRGPDAAERTLRRTKPLFADTKMEPRCGAGTAIVDIVVVPNRVACVQVDAPVTGALATRDLPSAHRRGADEGVAASAL